jgi:hypothetical protein
MPLAISAGIGVHDRFHPSHPAIFQHHSGAHRHGAVRMRELETSGVSKRRWSLAMSRMLSGGMSELYYAAKEAASHYCFTASPDSLSTKQCRIDQRPRHP